MSVIMIVLTILWEGVSPSVTQTATETTIATCQAAQQEMSGSRTVLAKNGSRAEIIRKIDCIPISTK